MDVLRAEENPILFVSTSKIVLSEHHLVKEEEVQ